MSIASQISRISGNVSDALTAIAAKGVTVPSGSDSDDLATLIGQISGGGTAAISIVDTTDSAGGTVRTITALDISDTTATALDVINSKYFYTADGVKTQGTGTGGGNDFIVTLTYNSTSQLWEPDKTLAEIQAAVSAGKTISTLAVDAYGVILSSSSNEDFISNYFAYCVEEWNSNGDRYLLKWFNLNSNGISAENPIELAAPSTFTTKSITTNGTYNAWNDDYVDGYSEVTVNVSPSLQAKTNISPTESSQTIQADNGYDGLSSVQINAISTTYVGSGITRRTANDIYGEYDYGEYSVNVPKGYYDAQYYKSVPNGSAGTPTATKGTVSNHSVTVTPSVTNTTGYIVGSTKTGTAATVSASELVSGSETKTSNGTYDVTNLAELVVNVGGTAAKTKTGTFTGTGSITVSITDVDFEPDLVFIYGDLTGSSSYRGVSTLIIIRDTIVLLISDASQSSSSQTLQVSEYGISGLNESSTDNPHATYSGTTLTVTTATNTASCRFNSSITYDYKLIKWTA